MLHSVDLQASQIEMLKAENAELRERVAMLEREFCGGGMLFPIEWCLTGSEQRVTGLLLSRPFARKDQIMTTLYRDVNRDEAEIKIVDVFVCKIRRKLKPFGIVIRTVWGQGYAIDEPQRGLLNGVVEPDADPEAARRTLSLIAEGARAA